MTLFTSLRTYLILALTALYLVPAAHAAQDTTVGAEQASPQAQQHQTVRGWLKQRFSRQPHVVQDPSTLVHDGRISMRDIDRWAQAQHLKNTWRSNSNKFPAGGFSYRVGAYSIHGHGANPAAKLRYPNSNSANGPTASITNERTDKVFRTDGTWGRFANDPNGAHIPLDDSPY